MPLKVLSGLLRWVVLDRYSLPTAMSMSSTLDMLTIYQATVKLHIGRGPQYLGVGCSLPYRNYISYSNLMSLVLIHCGIACSTASVDRVLAKFVS